jgi:hypothetical protein
VTVGGGAFRPCGGAAPARLVISKNKKRHAKTIAAVDVTLQTRPSGCRRFDAAEVTGGTTMSRDVAEKTGPAHSGTTRCCIIFSFGGELDELKGKE